MRKPFIHKTCTLHVLVTPSSQTYFRTIYAFVTEKMAVTTDKPKSRSILSMNADEARKFLLEERSYCRIDLPSYFKFEPVLHNVSNIMGKKPLAQKLTKETPSDHENVNHLITDNKDGRYAWRPMEIIHPVLYLSLVNSITSDKSWQLIRKRFCKFQGTPKISCHSIPVKSLSTEKNQAEQVSIWWKEIEQKSIELSLSYDHVIHTDISACYESIYTHSIAWALHDKKYAKSKKYDYSLIGNEIDKHTRCMRNGQTNGIPQGSVLFDFISEMVLGYADLLLSDGIRNNKGIEDYYILRYRDDYRIFTNNTQAGEAILKILTEVLIGLGLKLNSSKTQPSQNLVKAAIKSDKWDWIRGKQIDKNLLTHLLIIHSHGDRFPNSGSLIKALSKFFKRVCARKKHENVLSLIGVTVDIAVKNPRTYSVVAAILSHLLASLDRDKQKDVLERVRNRFSKIPNTSHMDIWMQRFTYFIDSVNPYQQPLCKLVANEPTQLWCSDWVEDKALVDAINPSQIVDKAELDNLNPLIQNGEIDLYLLESEWY